MTTIVLDTQRIITVTDQGVITRVTVAQAGVQGPQGEPTTVNGKTGTSITLVASDVGAIATSARGAVNGVAELDSSGLVPIGELPTAALAGDFLDLSTNQTIATGIKTFSVSPVVPTPSTGTQASNKTYVDNQVSAAEALALPLTGGTMTGAIVLPGNPSTSLQAAPKQYVDLMLPLAGGTMSGAIAMGSHKITGVTNGSSAQDVAAFGQLPSSSNILAVNSGGTGSGTQNFVDLTTGQTVAGVKAFSSPPTGPTPVGSTDLVNKAYADAISAGLQPKPSASLATTGALAANTYSNGSSGVGATLTATGNGVLTIDGTAVTLGMTILVKNEVTTANNGLYTCTTAGAVGAAYVLTRSVDMNVSTEFPGAYSYVESGTANVGSLWAVSGLGPFTIGTTAVTYVQVGGSSGISAGTGLTLTGSVMSLTNPVTVALGGTGQTSVQAAMDSFAGAVTSGQYLRGNGTHVVMAALAAGDLTGSVAVANGGTGGTTIATALSGLNLTVTTGTGSATSGTSLSTIFTGPTVAANSVAAGTTYEFFITGVCTTTAGTQTFNMGVYYGGSGGTLLLATGGIEFNSGGAITGVPFTFKGTITFISTTQAIVDQQLYGNYFLQNGGNAGTVTVSTTTAKSLVLTATCSASGASMTPSAAYIRQVK